MVLLKSNELQVAQAKESSRFLKVGNLVCSTDHSERALVGRIEVGGSRPPRLAQSSCLDNHTCCVHTQS